MKILRKPDSLENFDTRLIDSFSSEIDKTKIGKLLSFGAQNKVFEYGFNQVIKFPLNQEEANYIFSKWGWEPSVYFEQYKIQSRGREISNQLVQRKIQFDKSLSKRLANSRIYDQIILQDRVKLWWEVYDNSPILKQKELVSVYVDQILYGLWKYNLHEKVYNFSTNCGFDSKGDIVLFDFGELTNDEKIIEDHFLNNQMLKCWSGSNLHLEVLEFYRKYLLGWREVFDKRWSKEELVKS